MYNPYKGITYNKIPIGACGLKNIRARKLYEKSGFVIESDSQGIITMRLKL